MSWWAIGVAVVSAGVQMYNTDQTAKRQDRQLAESIRNGFNVCKTIPSSFV